MMRLELPTDKELLASVGELTLRHEHLDHILRMTVRVLTGREIDEALTDKKLRGSATLREEITKQGKRTLGQGEDFSALCSLLSRCEDLTTRRNEIVHSLWAEELDGEPARRYENGEWHALPNPADLYRLSEEIRILVRELLDSRFDDGVLGDMIKRAQMPSEEKPREPAPSLPQTSPSDSHAKSAGSLRPYSSRRGRTER